MVGPRRPRRSPQRLSPAVDLCLAVATPALARAPHLVRQPAALLRPHPAASRRSSQPTLRRQHTLGAGTAPARSVRRDVAPWQLRGQRLPAAGRLHTVCAGADAAASWPRAHVVVAPVSADGVAHATMRAEPLRSPRRTSLSLPSLSYYCSRSPLASPLHDSFPFSLHPSLPPLELFYSPSAVSIPRYPHSLSPRRLVHSSCLAQRPPSSPCTRQLGSKPACHSRSR